MMAPPVRRDKAPYADSQLVLGGHEIEHLSKSMNNVLEERFTHAILMSLYRRNKQKKTALLSTISKSSSIGKRIDALEENGLITVTIDRFDNNTKWIELTERGQKISELLVEIYEIIDA